MDKNTRVFQRLTVYFVEKCDIIASVYEKGDIGKFMSVKDLTTYEVLKERRFKGY